MHRYFRSYQCLGRMVSSKPAQKASTGPNWNKMLASATSEEEKAAISAARASLLKLQALVVEAEKPAMPIDWKYYEEAISEKSLVKEFKTAYDKLTFKKDPEAMQKIPEAMKADHQAATEEIKKIVDRVSEYIKSLEKQLVNLESNKKELQSATVESFLKKNPQLDQKYNEEIKNENWF